MNFLIKKLLAPKGMEYLTITKELIIEEMSFGVKRFADRADVVEIGEDCRHGFPELVGMESVMMQILWGWNTSLELKGISRFNLAPLYIDLYIMGGQDQPNRINNNLIIFFEDVTDQMVLEQTLAQRSHEASLLLSSLSATKDYLQKIITAIADALIVTTKSGQIKTVNPAAQVLFGYSEYELVNQPISLIFTSRLPESESGISPSLSKNISNNFATDFSQTIEVVCQRRDTSNVTVAFSCSTIPSAVNGIEDLVYIGRDITEQLQIQENLKLAQIKAEEASKAKSLFLANMSHEIRTPMNGVLGLTELLMSTDLDSRQRDFAEGIKTSGRNLLTIINEILDLSKLEAGKVRVEVYEFDLRNCVEDVIDLLAPLAHSKGLELTCMIHPSLPLSVRGDGARLGQILTNFLSNAIKFSATGEILVEALPQPQKGVIFRVIDQGIGISAETISQLFSPFTQADNSTTRKYGGTGLGLAICKQLTKLMGGKIGVESTVGKGSQFWISLPFDLAFDRPTIDLQPDLQANLQIDLTNNDNQSVNQSVASKNSKQLAGHRLLVVDRHSTTRQAICTYAQYWGIAVETASTKAQALAVLASNLPSNPTSDPTSDLPSQAQIDLVIIELEMVDSSFMQHPLIITTYVNQDLNQASHQLFAQEAIAQKCEFTYLVKPLHLNRLFNAMQSLLKIKRLLPTTPSLDSNQLRSVLHILIAEDNAINQKVLYNLLEGLGHRLDIAADGAEVLKLYELNNYDMILMDCQMPILDGFATTADIRRREGGDRHTVIIAVTANAMNVDKERCLAAGMDDYLSKPFYRVEIENIINKWSKA